MTAGDEQYFDEEVEAYIDFGSNGVGSFQFGYVQGDIDYRTTDRDGKPAIEFSWEGGLIFRLRVGRFVGSFSMSRSAKPAKLGWLQDGNARLKLDGLLTQAPFA